MRRSLVIYTCKIMIPANKKTLKRSYFRNGRHTLCRYLMRSSLLLKKKNKAQFPHSVFPVWSGVICGFSERVVISAFAFILWSPSSTFRRGTQQYEIYTPKLSHYTWEERVTAIQTSRLFCLRHLRNCTPLPKKAVIHIFSHGLWPWRDCIVRLSLRPTIQM